MALSKENIDNILTVGKVVGGTIQAQRQASGAAAARQARIEACGRKPIIAVTKKQKQKKADYDKCVQRAQQGGEGSEKSTSPLAPPPLAPPPTQGDGTGGDAMKRYIMIGVGVILVGAVGFFLFKKFKK